MKLSAFLLVLLLPLQLSAEDLPLAKVPVVHTWKDLLALKPLIDADWRSWPPRAEGLEPAEAGRIKIRVGIDRTASKLNDAAVLYCLAESAERTRLPSQNETCLGPLQVTVESPKPPPHALAEDKKVLQDALQPARPYRLFLKVIPLTQPGKYKIKIAEWVDTSGQGKTRDIAIAEVEVGDESIHLWYPWQNLPKEEKKESASSQKSAEAAEDTETALVSNPEGGPALPTIEGWIDQIVSKETDPDWVLPRPIPEALEDGNVVFTKQDTILVRLKDNYDLYWAADYFLTRWWVNGKPVKLSEKYQPVMEAREEARAVIPSNQVNFDIKFAPGHLGAKEGDEIGLQLLFCPFHWAYTSDINALTRAIPNLDENEKPSLSQLLPRVNFVWKGGHLAPATQ